MLEINLRITDAAHGHDADYGGSGSRCHSLYRNPGLKALTGIVRWSAKADTIGVDACMIASVSRFILQIRAQRDVFPVPFRYEFRPFPAK